MKMNFETNTEGRLEQSFEEEKRIYFSRLALRVASAMRMHKNPGLLWERKGGVRDWGNVSEHCLVELARANVLARKLGLPEATKRELELGAALHDFDKRSEIMAMRAAIARGESGSEASDRADEEGERQLRKAGFSQEVLDIASSSGGKYPELFEMVRLLEKDKLTDHDVACLIIHYVDGYTRGSEWADPVAVTENGEAINEVDRRTQKNLDNPTYKKFDEESVAQLAGNPIFRGMGSLRGEGLVCHMIEKHLAERIHRKTGEMINPLILPEIIDQEIRSEIDVQDAKS